MPKDKFSLPDDSVDRLIQEWAEVAPELDTKTVGVVNRLRIVDMGISAEMETLFASFGLTRASFAVLSTLARDATGAGMSQKRLADRLGLTAGTMSVRLDRMERDELVFRSASRDDARSTMVRLTELGQRQLNQCVPAYLDMQSRLVSSLTQGEQDHLANLLKKLMAGLESDTTMVADIGLAVSTVRQAIELQRRLGIKETPGLLVENVLQGSRAGQAGLSEGDLLVELNGRLLLSVIDLAEAAASGEVMKLGVVKKGSHTVLSL